MSNLVHKSKSELVAGLSRARNSIQNAKAQTKAITRRTANTGITAGAGFAVGALRSRFGEGEAKAILLPGTEVEADLAFGVLASLAGVAGMADEYSDLLCSAGGGALAANLAIRGFNQG